MKQREEREMKSQVESVLKRKKRARKNKRCAPTISKECRSRDNVETENRVHVGWVECEGRLRGGRCWLGNRQGCSERMEDAKERKEG